MLNFGENGFYFFVEPITLWGHSIGNWYMYIASQITESGASHSSITIDSTLFANSIHLMLGGIYNWLHLLVRFYFLTGIEEGMPGTSPFPEPEIAFQFGLLGLVLINAILSKFIASSLLSDYFRFIIYF